MPAFICTTCGCQYPDAETPPQDCLICRDSRQYVNPAGQAWTTLPAMRRSYFNAFRWLEPDLMGIGTFPSFAIGQRALLVRTPEGNFLWDCISFLDDATITMVRGLGGLAGIIPSHPHFLATVVEWSRAFEAPVHVHARARGFVTRPDPAIRFWEDDRLTLAGGLSVIRCGGHFPGSAVLHWPSGASGRGAILTGDTLQVRPDKGLTFMHSYPNLIPLPATTVRRLADRLAPLSYDALYGGWWERVIPTNARQAVARSVAQYIQALSEPDAAD